MTVVQDQQVELQCVTTAWFPIPTVTWTQNGKAVDSSLYNTTDMANGDSFNTTSVLKLQAVSNTTVACWATVPALTNPTSSSVFLVVGKKVFNKSLYSVSSKHSSPHPFCLIAIRSLKKILVVTSFNPSFESYNIL